MPAEWEPHAGCWMAWPERPDNWREEPEPAQAAFAAVAEAIAASEPVTMAVSAGQFEQRPGAAAGLGARRRDLPPTTPGCATSARASSSTAAGGRRGVDWRFNAWGGLVAGSTPGTATTGSPRKVLEIEGADRYRAPLVLEGGSIHVDGEGTVLTTEECLLNPNRNPDLDRGEIEAAAAASTSGAEQGDLARRGVSRRRDRRPRRQPRLLRRAPASCC